MANGTIAFDTLTTSDSANTGTEKSIDTSYLFNGVAKVWQQAQGDSTITDSFNVSSMTDNATGQFITVFTNSMSNAFYSGLSTGMSGDHLISAVGNTATGQCRFDHYNQSNSAIDTGLHCVGILGDLA